MKKSTIRIAVCGLLAALVAAAPVSALAQEKKNDKAATEKKEPPKGEKKQGAIPYNGKVTAIDKTAKTVTVGERTFQITSETRIMKAGKPATLDDGVVGEVVGGQYRKTDDGKLVAQSVRFGPKPEGAERPAGEKKEKEKKAVAE